MTKLKKITLGVFVALFGFMCAYSHAESTGMMVTLKPGRNVFSTPALLSNISFSNEGNGISFLKMEHGLWHAIVPSTGNITPLEGFLVRNSNNSNVNMRLLFKETTPTEDMLSKSVDAGWNLLGITSINDPFYSIAPRMYLDFTRNSNLNLHNGINVGYLAGNGTVQNPEIGEAYGIFLSSDSLYGGSNNKSFSRLTLSTSADFVPGINVTPGSYNIPLLKGSITANQKTTINNIGFYLDISGSNPYEDIWGYEAGGLIYEIKGRIGACIGYLSYDTYNSDFGDAMTDASGYKKIRVNLDFGNCVIYSGTNDFEVLLGINREYYHNFQTGMSITSYGLNSDSFDGVYVEGEVLSSVVYISHDNLPNVEVTSINNQTDVVYIDSEGNSSQDFLLRSGNFYTDETGVDVSLLFNKINKTDVDVVLYNMYLDTYVNGVLLDTQLYRDTSIKNIIPLEPNSNTLVEFKGRMTSNRVGSFRPTVTVNEIIKNNIRYVTHNCDYYEGWCTEFGLGNYRFNGMIFYINGGLASGHISNDVDYEPNLYVTPGSYNIPLLRGRAYLDDDAYLNKDGFLIDIVGANPYEDVGGYEAGGIIYDMAIRVGDCVSTVPRSLYSNLQTNGNGFARFYVPMPEECKTLSAGATKIEVSMGVNKEYYQNFNPGMTIHIDMISNQNNALHGNDFNSVSIMGEILPSVVHVGHYYLPSLSVSSFTNPTNTINIAPGAYDFPLRSGDFYTDETGLVANVLLKTSDPGQFNMYVSTYVNGELVDEQLYDDFYDSVLIKHEIPLERGADTLVEFRGRMISLNTGSFRPTVIVNKIIKNGINYVTYNCDYYAGWCTEFGLGNFIFNGQGTNVVEGSNNYPTELVQAYNYAYSHGLTTMSIDNADMYGNLTRIAMAKMMSNYVINILGLVPDTTMSCSFTDVSATLDAQYDDGVTKLCQLGLIGTSDEYFYPNELTTVADFGTILSRALNANDTDKLTELNNSNPYYSGHLNRLKEEGILNNANPSQPIQRGYAFLYLMRSDSTRIPTQGCSEDELLDCLSADDYDACVASCSLGGQCATTTGIAHTISTRDSDISSANIICTWSGDKVTITWMPENNIGNVKISLYNESTNTFDMKGTVNASCVNSFSFTGNHPSTPIIRLDDTEGLGAYKTYTCHSL